MLVSSVEYQIGKFAQQFLPSRNMRDTLDSGRVSVWIKRKRDFPRRSPDSRSSRRLTKALKEATINDGWRAVAFLPWRYKSSRSLLRLAALFPRPPFKEARDRIPRDQRKSKIHSFLCPSVKHLPTICSDRVPFYFLHRRIARLFRSVPREGEGDIPFVN